MVIRVMTRTRHQQTSITTMGVIGLPRPLATADAVCDLAKKLDVDMPICKATLAVLKGKLEPEKAVSMLMSRDKKDEVR